MRIPSRIAEIGATSQDPVYVYDLGRLRSRMQALERLAWPRTSLFFATMANDHPAILRRPARGHGVFVNSPRHLKAAFAAGFEPSRVVYAATNMTADEIGVCIDCGARLVLDSVGQLALYCDLAGPGGAVGIRVSVGSALEGKDLVDDPSYRFGLEPSEIATAVATARRAGVRIVGVHSYFGTNLPSPDALLEGLDRLGRFGRLLPDLRYIDAGGGFGLSGDGPHGRFDLDRYSRSAARLMGEHERRLGRPLELYLEPGRYLVAECGYFFVKVTDRKFRPDRVFVGTNGSVAIFPRPLFHPARAEHPCRLLGPRGDEAVSDRPVYLCGNSTYSRDFLAREAAIPLPELGETVGFLQAGAYCRSMVTDFLGKEWAEEIVVDDRDLVEAPSDSRDDVAVTARRRPSRSAERAHGTSHLV